MLVADKTPNWKYQMKDNKPHALVGKRIKYRYEGGWEYHVNYESENKISYDVVSGPFGAEKPARQHLAKRLCRTL